MYLKKYLSTWLIFFTSIMHCEEQYAKRPNEIEWTSLNPKNKEYRYILRGICPRDKKLIRLIKRIVNNSKNKSEIEGGLRKYVASVKAYTPSPGLVCIKVNKPRVAKTFTVSAGSSELNRNIKSVINMVGLCDFDEERRSQIVGKLMHSSGIYNFKYSEKFYEIWPGIYKLYIKVKNNGPAKDRILVNKESPLSADVLQACVPPEDYSDSRKVYGGVMRQLHDMGYFEAKIKPRSKVYNKKHNTIDWNLEINAGNKYLITSICCNVDDRLPRSVESDIRNNILMQFPNKHPLTEEFGKTVLEEIKKYFKQRNINCLQPIEIAFKMQNASSDAINGVLVFRVNIDDSSAKVLVDVNEQCLSSLIILPAASQDLEIESGDPVSSYGLHNLKLGSSNQITLKGDRLKLNFDPDDKSGGLPELNFPEFYWKIGGLCFGRSDTILSVNLAKVADLFGYNIDILPQLIKAPSCLAAEAGFKQSEIFSLQHNMQTSPRTNISVKLNSNSELFSNPLGQALKDDLITGGGALVLPVKLLYEVVISAMSSKNGQRVLNKISAGGLAEWAKNKAATDQNQNDNVTINEVGANIRGTHILNSYDGVNTKLYGNAKIEHKNFQTTKALESYFCDKSKSEFAKLPNHISGSIGIEVTRDVPYRSKFCYFAQLGCIAEAIKNCKRDAVVGVKGLCGAKKAWPMKNEWLDGEIECDAAFGSVLGGNALQRLTAQEISPEHHHQIGKVEKGCNLGGKRGLRLCAGLRTDRFLVQVGIADTENTITDLLRPSNVLANVFCSFGMTTRLGRLRFTFSPFSPLLGSCQKNVVKGLTLWEKNCMDRHE